jgi:hypothetical protein
VVVSVRHRRGQHGGGSSPGKGVCWGDEDELDLDTIGVVTDELTVPNAELDGTVMDLAWTPTVLHTDDDDNW